MTNRINVAIYARVSTSEQAENGHSIDEQQERMRKFCESFGWSVFDAFVDAGFSGANMARPALTSLIKAVKAHKVDKVLVYKLDRLSRSQKDTLNLIEDVFLKNNVDFVSMSENFDTSTPFGRAMVGILAVFAQLERETIKERMAMGREARAKSGKHRGSAMIPIGYEYKNGVLSVNEFEAMQVKTVFRLFLEGKSLYKIVDYMNDNGFVHHYGSWQAQTVRNVLKHEVYVGKIVFRGKTYQGEHEAIISQDIFDKTQALLKERAKEHSEMMMRTGRIQSYLGGLLYCGKCGAKFSKRSRSVKNSRYEKYECLSRWGVNPTLIKDPSCKNKIWDMKKLDEIVFNEIKKLAIDETYRNSIVTTSERQSDTVKHEIDKINESLSRIMDLYVIGQFPVDELREKTEALVKKKDKLEASLDMLLLEESAQLSYQETIDAIRSFADVLNRGNFDEIRLVIESLIEKIEVNDDDVTIHWKFS